jgi:hypothetical protein
VTYRGLKSWLETLEKLILARGLVAPEELDRRPAEYASGARDDHDDHVHLQPRVISTHDV